MGRDAPDDTFNGRYAISGSDVGSFHSLDDLRRYDLNVQPVEYKLELVTGRLMTATGFYVIIDDARVPDNGGNSPNNIYQIAGEPAAGQHYIKCNPASVVKGVGIKCWNEDGQPTTTDPFTYSTGSFHPLSLTAPDDAVNYLSITMVVSDVPPARVIPDLIFSLKVTEAADAAFNDRHVIAGSQSGSYQGVNDITRFDANVQYVQYKLEPFTAFLMTASGMYVIEDDNHPTDNDGNSPNSVYQVAALTTAAEHNIMCDPATIVIGSAINCWRQGEEPPTGDPFTYSSGPGNPLSLVAPDAVYRSIRLLVDEVQPPYIPA
jgi:hypothetical protein